MAKLTFNTVRSFTRAGSWGGSGGQDPPAPAPIRSFTRAGSWGGSGGQDPPTIAKRAPDPRHARLLFVSALTLLPLAGCHRTNAADTALEAPPPAKVVQDVNVSLFTVDHPEQFPLVLATLHAARAELTVTGSVSPDVSRSVPVTSIAAGRVTGIYARLGDTVKKGQRLLTVLSDDVSGGFSDYEKAKQDEDLSRVQLDRARDLFDHGAVSLNDLQIAQNAESKAKLDVQTHAQHLRLLGNNPDHANAVVDISAPAAGVITDQQVTKGAALQGMGSTPFTISDLSHVWIVCDVYENDLPHVRLGDSADVRLNAYPDQTFKGTISNISAILDSSLRTAKVRIEVDNPGLMHLGMFATATFQSQEQETHTAVPASAVLHLHDRDWVYEPAPDSKFRRVEVVGGKALPNNLQEVKSGIAPGQQLVANALVLDHAIDQ
jgi:cobalt-zinc-cadmium efflux system membrane fusion protein